MLVMERGRLDDFPTDNLSTVPTEAQFHPISLCLFVSSTELGQAIIEQLPSDRYVVSKMHSIGESIEYICQQQHQIDCLVTESNSDFSDLVEQLHQCSIFLPTVLLTEESTPEISDQVLASGSPKTSNFIYHSCEVDLNINQLSKVDIYVNQAIRKFITHAITTRLSDSVSASDPPTAWDESIIAQQKRLAEKLHERLGYLGVYYKRNPPNFLRNLPPTERQELLEQLQSKYRQIVLNYFSKDPDLNHKIDEYVTIAFFADIPISRIVEIHMELMDNLSKQLKIEGRNEDVLLDYRLTLIDIMAHICEMYRRSIPKGS